VGGWPRRLADECRQGIPAEVRPHLGEGEVRAGERHNLGVPCRSPQPLFLGGARQVQPSTGEGLLASDEQSQCSRIFSLWGSVHVPLNWYRVPSAPRAGQDLRYRRGGQARGATRIRRTGCADSGYDGRRGALPSGVERAAMRTQTCRAPRADRDHPFGAERQPVGPRQSRAAAGVILVGHAGDREHGNPAS